MAKEAFWFKHDLNARSDKEMVKLRMKMGMEGVGLYWCIIEMLYEEGGYLMRSEYERIAFEMQTHPDRIAQIIETHSLFKMDDRRFWSESLIRRMNARAEKSVKASRSASIKWANANASETQCDSMPIRRDNKKRREEIRGISFSEDKKTVTLADNTIQELGLEQLRWVKEGGYEPHRVKKGIIE